ncbi:F-box protein At2g16365-like [Solanum pennellii]|uniref:F-box protein At2g16365-like n=1 Tax=Solanum pennellii TaxID=28526 RepID=A0ABM1HQX1_SOLPN|nr:F-box protein At2g16365-like [Solanum pennellii]
MDLNIPALQALDCLDKEVGHKLPDLNLELPSLTDKLEPTSSTTHSLDLRLFLGHNEQPSPLKTDFSLATLLEDKPGSRWVKRLKLSASSNVKANKSHCKNSKVTITGSVLTAGKLHCEELMDHDRTLALARNSDSSPMYVMKKQHELLTSLSWVQRWLHKRSATAQNRPKSVVVCEPCDSKSELGDFQKKQVPSIAAMALMGKAITGFQPCEFQIRGPCLVWNTVVSEIRSSNSYFASGQSSGSFRQCVRGI